MIDAAAAWTVARAIDGLLRLIYLLDTLRWILCDTYMVLRHGPRLWRIQRHLRRRAYWRNRQ